MTEPMAALTVSWMDGPWARGWLLELRRLATRLDGEQVAAASPLRVNIVFRMGDRSEPSESCGVQLGPVDHNGDQLTVQAAVGPVEVGDRRAVLSKMLIMAADEAEVYARREGLADTLPEVRRLAAMAGGVDWSGGSALSEAGLQELERLLALCPARRHR